MVANRECYKVDILSKVGEWPLAGMSDVSWKMVGGVVGIEDFPPLFLTVVGKCRSMRECSTCFR